MTKEDFYKEMEKALTAQKPEEIEISFTTVDEPNCAGLHVCSLNVPGYAVVPTFRLEDLYEIHLNGLDPEIIARGMFEYVKEKHIDTFPGEIDINNYESVRKNLAMMVIGVKDNREFLEKTVYRKVEDLALVPIIFINDEKEGEVFKIYKETLEKWGVAEEDFLKEAENNAPRLMPPQLQKMSDIFHDPAVKDVYMITNKYYMCGAAALFYPGFLDFMTAALGTDIYILPSSVNEAVILSVRDVDAEGLLQLVKSVNSMTLSPQEFLSDAVYRYSRTDGFKKALPAD